MKANLFSRLSVNKLIYINIKDIFSLQINESVEKNFIYLVNKTNIYCLMKLLGLFCYPACRVRPICNVTRNPYWRYHSMIL